MTYCKWPVYWSFGTPGMYNTDQYTVHSGPFRANGLIGSSPMHVGYKIMPTTIHSKTQKMPSLAVDRYINTSGCLRRFIETQIHFSTKENTILNRVNQIIGKQLCSRCTVQSIAYDGYRLSTTWDMLLLIHSWYCMWYHYQYGAILQADGLANIQATLPSKTDSYDHSYSTFYGFMTVWHTRVHLFSNSPSHNC